MDDKTVMDGIRQTSNMPVKTYETRYYTVDFSPLSVVRVLYTLILPIWLDTIHNCRFLFESLRTRDVYKERLQDTTGSSASRASYTIIVRKETIEFADRANGEKRLICHARDVM